MAFALGIAVMALTRQLWLAIALVMLIAFGGSAVVSSLSARVYLEDQLALKNLDNANALAVTLSQLPKDATTVELLIAAQFDTGHYQRIVLVDPEGATIVERDGDVAPERVPAWFLRLNPIEAAPGVAQVQDGWQQYGTLTVTSHAGFAQEELWRGSIRLFAWFAAAALLTGLIGSLVLRLILRPLERVVEQAEAIAERRFVLTDVPRTPEFGRVVGAMNALSGRVQRMLEDESARLDRLRVASHHDPATGLLNRAHFIARAQTLIGRDDAGAQGVLVIARLMDLRGLNQVQGWDSMDSLIQRFGEALGILTETSGRTSAAEWLAGRLNGSEFVVLAPGADDPAAVARQVQDVLRAIGREFALEQLQLPTAAVAYRPGDRLSNLFARIDVALETSAVEDAVVVAGKDGGTTPPTAGGDLMTWRARFDTSLVPGQIKLLGYPVVAVSGDAIHDECVARLRLGDGSDWLTAAEFLPWLTRLGEVARLDEIVVDLALEAIRAGSTNISINLAPQSLEDGFLQRIAGRIGTAGNLAGRLSVEVPEYGVFRKLGEFRRLCALLQPLGCRIGIEHMGHAIARIGELRDVGIDYIKVDASFVHGIESNAANQVFLRGLVSMAHAIGVLVIAEGVETDAGFTTVAGLGFDGATGPAITARLPEPVA
jgi:EAL domain-containing protein (putative c-di-GMP-specific phosphodiesterase class I)/GGDEF domain-containing protein